MIDFPRYLSAKKTIDDRAINRTVWGELVTATSALERHRPLRILEVACGIGTMVERMLEWGLAEQVDYLGIDTQPENIQTARKRLPDWGRENGYHVRTSLDQIEINRGDLDWRVNFQEADIKSFWHGVTHHGYFDLLVAQAFLDLIDVPKALSNLARLLSHNGLFYFTINFDGGTIFEPVSDEQLEAQIIECYHQSMDGRLVAGLPSGDSRTGRHLFTHLRSAGARILSSGASDWVVYPGPQGYRANEAFFLECILDFVESTLDDCPDLDPSIWAKWLEERYVQIERGELVFIAHQLDFLGTFS
jgi:SAM-dependent methyltransferase